MNMDVQSKTLQTRSLLGELLTNYLWVWQDRIQQVFEVLPTYQGHPNQAVHALSEAQLSTLGNDALFMARLREAIELQRSYLALRHEGRRIAYFSAEFGIHETLPIYSGGLGVLAGDHVKSASDLNLPMVAIGLMYRQGYFNQQLGKDGWQIERYTDLNMELTCLSLVHDAQGRPLRLQVPIEDRQVQVRVWLAPVGRTPLYLLDTNLPENSEIDRWITGHLYGGDQDTRIKQEVVLGIGGVRLLTALGYPIEVFHMNEGHAAFLTLELLAQKLRTGMGYKQAADEISESCVFTTHTPVPAGHDAFSHELLLRVLDRYRHDELGISQFELLLMGGRGRFSMTELALNLSRSTNAVAKRHGEVSRRMFPHRAISHVTNGIHHLTWASPQLAPIFDELLPGWRQEPAVFAGATEKLPDDLLRSAHTQAKVRLIEYVNTHAHGIDLEPGLLTIGFARRFATYKRGDLIVQAIDKLPPEVGARIQLVFAGKSHPRDDGGKQYIQKIHSLMQEKRTRLVFLENYDMSAARMLVTGVDIWMNTPRRPLEASGTSGMKAALNGIPHLSVLDGWWVEGYNGRNGWAVGEDYDGSVDEDEYDSASIAQLLSEQILDEFYGRPADWTQRMKEAVATAAFFNTHRMVEQYSEQIYRLPALVTS